MIDAILAHLPPDGARPARDDFIAMRLLEPTPLAAADTAPLPTSYANAVAGASRAGLGPLAPVRILGQVALAEDGSFQAEVPAFSPYRMQAVASDGMAAGHPHNRWLHHEAGQRVPQGVSARLGGPYQAVCATCHGAADGNAAHALPIVADLVSSASWTLSRFQGGDPRRPLAPVRLGDESRVSVAYRSDIGPLLATRCASAGCHSDASAAGGLRLTLTPTQTFDIGYEALLARGDGSGGGYRWVDAATGRARRSYLIEKLLGQELDAPRMLPPAATPHGDLSAAERALLATWIDLGATWR